MLSPTHYRTDCEAIVGVIIDHKLLSSEEIQERYEASVKVWMDNCQVEPYDFVASGQQKATTLTYGQSDVVYQQRSTYDIAAAVQRQRNFNYQV
jgi:hypothetical protein